MVKFWYQEAAIFLSHVYTKHGKTKMQWHVKTMLHSLVQNDYTTNLIVRYLIIILSFDHNILSVIYKQID